MVDNGDKVGLFILRSLKQEFVLQVEGDATVEGYIEIELVIPSP